MIFYSPSFLPAESLQTGGVRWNIHGKILAFEQFLRLVAAQFCVERGMPSGVQGERDLGRKRLLQVDADRLAAQSIALERLGEYGDRTAFEELYVHFAPRLVAFFERRGLDRRRSQETMQDVMAKIWEKAPLFDPNKASASTWIYTLARNRLIDLIRKDERSKIDYTDPALRPDEPASPDQMLQEKDRALALQAAIFALPADQAAVLTGIYMDGLKQTDLADQLGIPLNTLKSRLRLALSKIRASMETTL